MSFSKAGHEVRRGPLLILLIVVLAGFVAAPLAPWLCRSLGATRGGALLALVPLTLCATLAAIGPEALAGRGIFEAHPWVSGLGVGLDLRLDGLALVFALLITGIGSLVVLYAGAYLGDPGQAGRFLLFLLAFMASMLGVVLADGVITLFVFWELTSVTSWLLIGFDHEKAESRRAALQALLVTALGGVALLAGLLLLGAAGGSMRLSELEGARSAILSSGLYEAILVLVLLGAATKSAQFPFHFWLPNAMAAPTPASAYLHSSTMVKAGVYLLARLSPTLGATELFTLTVTSLGAATFVLGAVLAAPQTKLKRLLAYSTVSSLGLLVMLLGVGTQAAVVAAGAYLVAHALFKAALFLVAGAVDHETGERDVEKLGGLRSAMPITAAAAGLAALSMAGIPPLLGFVAKEVVYEAALPAPGGVLVIGLSVVANALLLLVAFESGVRPFVGALRETPRKPHEAPAALSVGPVLLGAAGLALGMAPALASSLFVDGFVASVHGEAPGKPLSLWHGFTPALGLSALTVVIGLAAVALRATLRRAGRDLAAAARFGPERAWDALWSALLSIARAQTDLLQGRRLRHGLALTALASGAFVVSGLLAGGLRLPPIDVVSAPLAEWALGGLLVLGCVAALLARTALAAVAVLGIIGTLVTLVFARFSAPDLAVTQFVIETLTVILFVLVLFHLPNYARLSRPSTRLRDGLLATSFGVVMTLLALSVGSLRRDDSITRFLAAESVPGGHGRNVVNVILVDFRALDTLGEITVLGVAAVGAFALLKLRPRG